MSSRLQQLYEVKIEGGKGKMIDVTTDVIGNVTYEEREDLIATLTFNLSKGIKYLGVLKTGRRIEFYGGTTDPTNQKLFFKGNLVFIRSSFPDNGLAEAQIIAHDGTYERGTRSNENHLYPSKKSSRVWARKAPIKASEIARNIVEVEMGLNFGSIYDSTTDSSRKALIVKTDVEFKEIKPYKQHYTTDWAFLRELAKRLNCVAWSELNSSGILEVFFVDEDIVRNIESEISFVYPGRDFEAFETPALQPFQRLLRSFSINEDSDAAHGNIRTITKFNADGDPVNLLVEIDEEKKKFYYYELDEEAVRKADPAELDRLYSLGATGIPFETAKLYYKQIEAHNFGSKDFGVMGRPFVGIRASGTIDGDVNISSKKSYAITGISTRYSTRDSGTLWYMTACTHVWGDSGYETEMKFFR